MRATIIKCTTLGVGVPRSIDFLKYEHPGNRFDKKAVLSQCRTFLQQLNQGQMEVSSQSERILSLLIRKGFSLEGDGWYYAADYDEYTLTRLFWMDPSPRDLYNRYHDVVTFESTLQTDQQTAYALDLLCCH
jgi:hypothetical protein